MFHSVGRIMRWAGAYRKRMVLGFVCSFFATWCTAGPVVLAAWALGQLIVDAWGEERLSPHLPWLCLGGIVVLILLRFFFTYWKNRLQESIGTERAAEQRMELGNVLKRVSLGYFAKNDLGDILAALTTELSTLELQSMKMVDAVVNGYIQVAVILLCVAFFCPPAALAALIGVLVSAFALRGIGRQSARTAPVSHRAQEALSGAAIEYIHGLPVVKSFGQDGVSVQRFREACRANKAIRIKNEFGFVPWNCLHLFALRAASVGLVLTAGWQALAGALPLQYFLMIALFSFTIFGSVEAINDAAHILSVTDSVLDRLEELEQTDFIDKGGKEVVPEDGRLKLRRTLSLDELRRQGAWPPTGARAELAFSAGSPGGPHPPEGWHWEEAPARRMGEPLLARAAGGGRALYRPEPEGFSLAFPYAETRAFPLTPLFCFARVERMNGEFYAVFPFWSGGCPRLPHKPAQAGQTIGANQTKEETRHGEPNHQGADRPVRPAQF